MALWSVNCKSMSYIKEVSEFKLIPGFVNTPLRKIKINYYTFP